MNKSDTEYLHEDIVADLAEAATIVEESFAWNTSPEGEEYWEEVFAKLLEKAQDAERNGYTRKKKLSRDRIGELDPAHQILVPIPDKPKEIVHLLHMGSTTCGNPVVAGRPVDWPQSHTWVTMADWETVTCGECITKANEAGIDPLKH